MIGSLESSQIRHRQGWDLYIDAANAATRVCVDIGHGMNGVEKVVERVLSKLWRKKKHEQS